MASKKKNAMDILKEVKEKDRDGMDLRDEIDYILSQSNCHALKNSAEFDVQYPTGFFSLDYKNGQRINGIDKNGNRFSYDSIGIVDGSINMFIGRSGCGKSTFVKQIAANIVRPFSHGFIFEDSVEGGIVSVRNEILTGFTSEEIKHRLKLRNAGVTINNTYAQIKAIHDTKIQQESKYRYNTGLLDTSGNEIWKFQPTVYIIDSIAMLTTDVLSEEEELSGQMSTTATAKALAQFFRRITPLIKEANIILLCINHITQKIEINPFAKTKSQNIWLREGEALPGGVTPLYLANNIFRMDDGNKLTQDKDFGIDGCHVIVSLIKSRTAVSGLSSAVDLIFNYDTGFDPDLSMYMMLKEYGLISGSGAYFHIANSDIKFMQKQLKEKLNTDDEFATEFATACMNVFRNIFDDQEKILKTNKVKANNLLSNMIRQNQMVNNTSSNT